MSARRILLCGLNWIGDNIMAMPAVQALRVAHPGDDVTMLVKRGLAPLWQMHSAPTRVLTYEDTHTGTFDAGREMRGERFDVCYVLPNSFRSAWIPYIAQIPGRIGLRGGIRAALLTKKITPRPNLHQQFEYFDLFSLGDVTPGPPLLAPSPEATERARVAIGAHHRPVIGLIPGAARGASKRWPAAHFVTVGRRCISERHATVFVFGSGAERDLCCDVAREIGPGAQDVSGTTTLPEWAAMLQACDLVFCNDSGGMHLAAAIGTAVVAVYGMTDPGKTGPLGDRVRIVQDAGARSRDIARAHADAEKRLAAISPEEVYEAAAPFLN